jgi:hypothetical protein
VGRALLGVLIMGSIGVLYASAAAPVAAHREYKGAIRQVENLAGLFTARDLVIVEGRAAGSDFHVLALPLAYEYGLPVLVLESPRPDKRQFEAFLDDALQRYERVLFVGGGGTDLLSQRITAEPVSFARLEVPELETIDCTLAMDCPGDPPDDVRRKDLSYSVFRLRLGDQERKGFSLDVGYLDDLQVLRFYAREVEGTSGETFRWTYPRAFVAVTGLAGTERELVLTMSAGGRPGSLGPATVDVAFAEAALGRVTVLEGFHEYRFALPAAAVEAAARSADPAQLVLVSNAWRPSDITGSPDTRELGVMVTRVEIH